MDANTGTDTIIEPSEGLLVTLVDGGSNCSPRMLFTLTLACSAKLHGKPVFCGGFLPGVSLLIHASQLSMPQLAEREDALWAKAQTLIDDWIDVAEQFPCQIVSFDGVGVTLALDRVISLNQGVMQIDVDPIGARRRQSAATPRPA